MGTMVYRNASVAANTKVSGVFAGQLEEYVKFRRAVIQVYASAAAVGLTLTANIGGQVVVNDQEVVGVHAAGGPLRPDDLIYQGGALNSDRVVIDVRNPTGAALTNLVILVDITPV